jgi:hypothetical protein
MQNSFFSEDGYTKVLLYHIACGIYIRTMYWSMVFVKPGASIGARIR